MRPVLVYVAGPYSAPTPEAVEANVNAALDAGDAIDDVPGLRAVIPHLSHFRHARRARTYEEWMAIDFDLLDRCDVLFRLPGPSSGADREVERAYDREMPVLRDMRRLRAAMELLVWVRDPSPAPTRSNSADAPQPQPARGF